MSEPPYFETVESCQVPNLAFLLSYFLGERPDGAFVEVGAYDGYTHSNTYGLVLRGWKGLLIEPIAEYASQCRARFEEYPDITVLETAVGRSGGSAQIYIGAFLTSTNLNAIRQYQDLGWGRRMITGESREVRMETLDSILSSRMWQRDFDLLVVDVEGAEWDVFAGFSIRQWTPRMMIVELHDGCPTLGLTRREDWKLQRSILGSGYSVVFKDHINAVFVRDDVALAAHNLSAERARNRSDGSPDE